MITDAMSALGLETSQMADFADKLAVTSQKSNTSVSQLGEAILTVGGTAKNLAGGVTEMNTVLGILADNGIKGAEGGTALRNVILSLTAPTSTAAEAIDSLGLSVFDNQGKMRSLQDIIYDLNDALGTMTDAEKSQALSDIFNKVDLKSINALLGTSAERFDELSGYIDSCSGAAADMAATMDDNLKGDLTIMQSALEGLGIAAYEKFQSPMRSAVQSVTEDIGTLTESLASGSLSDSFDKISEGFSGLLASASEILANDIIPAAINGLETIIKYGNEIISVAAGIGAAIAAVKIVPIITTAVAAIQTANLQLSLLAAQSGAAAISQTALAGGLTATEIAVGLFTGKITLATAAEAAFNAVCSINPIVLVATALAAATVALVTYANTCDSTHNKLKDINEDIENIKKTTEESIETTEDDIAVIKEKARKYEELREKADRTAGEEERLKELAEELQQYMPEGTQLIDEQTGAYNSLADSIDSVTEAMRRKAVMNIYEEEYEGLIRQQLEVQKEIEEMEANKEKYGTYLNPDDFSGSYYGASPKTKAKVLGENAYKDAQEQLSAINADIENVNNNINQLYEDATTGTAGAVDAAYNGAAIAAKGMADQYTEAAKESAEKLTEQQKENTAKLKEGWEQAEHDYAIGVIGSEEELIAEKQRIWNEYGDESCTDHWKYYEDLIDLQNDYADSITKADEQLAEERKAAVKAEWTAIEHQNSFGLISEEEAYQKKLAFIQKYCPEYSDEWYEYYKDVYDYQQAYADKQLDTLKDSISDQIDVVKDGLKDILSDYKSAYSDIQSNIDSYKNKLLSLGDAFSVIENEDGSKTLKVNNLKEQMAEMRKYTEYVKKLKEQGASQGLLEELTSMDAADGMEFAKQLANMSDADFAEINDYYKQREDLAQELAEDLYSSDVSKLNEKLVNDISEQFGMLPEEIQAIGAESVNAFIEGLGTGDLSEQVDSFIDSFGTDLDNGLDKMFENWNESITESIGDSVYEAGKTSGQDFVEGFNEALAELEAAVTAEQAKITAEYSGELKYDKKSIGGGDENGNGSGGKKIVVENHLRATLEVDGKKLTETVMENQNTIDRGKGK